ncbi:FTR1 family protein [Nocardia sp. CA2R105]|uniref:iron uptake transporter permease EfeU n=1 Tax=Nocardia coffeae TaxID=2873381 RepID=UPI001CA6362F|nr:iron uptake transporter permease EfeU [Nocardia coffeae]MBY8856117.1 FTR1 family protein [Nocardia coffeae]
MNWAEAVPNLLICLREGLEAGLVVTILLAAVRKAATAERPVSTAPIWLGLLGAISVAGSFAAVLTYSTSVLSSSAQQAVGGILSVLAVIMVTAMIFWMRRTAATLSKQLRGEVVRAAALGAGALALTAFLAVGREGLETTLFVWTAVKASGATVAPLIGAALGLIIAVALCWLLYRQSVRFNLGVFFNRTAVLLIVIAAGVLAYGLGDLQDAGWLPGGNWIAFDISAHADPNSWWVAIISGITELTPKMRVLQVVAWVVYLAVVIPLFVRAGRPAKAPAAATTAAATAPAAETAETATASATAPATQDAEPAPDWWERVAGPRLPLVATALVLVPVLAAGIAIALLPSSSNGSVQAVSISDSSCAPEWKSGKSGMQTFAIQNKTSKAGEINLLDAGGAIVGEIETIGPATTADMTATLGNGSYTITCLMSGKPKTTSPTVQVSGASGDAPPSVKPVTADDLTPANNAYQAAAAQALSRLAGAVTAIGNDVQADNIPAAQADWLNAQMEWERVGASYNSFGEAGTAVDGLPDGLPGGTSDEGFTGLHRIEYGLWHGQGADQLMPVIDRLGGDIANIQKNLGSDDLAGDPTNLPVRAHEILEDALRDHLFGNDDEGSGSAYPLTDADIDITRTVLDELGPLLDARSPGLRTELSAHLDTLHAALLATQDNGRWRAPAQTPQAQQQAVRAALGAALEDLARVPRLLEVPLAH